MLIYASAFYRVVFNLRTAVYSITLDTVDLVCYVAYIDTVDSVCYVAYIDIVDLVCYEIRPDTTDIPCCLIVSILQEYLYSLMLF